MPDYPQPGVMFKDITPLLADAGVRRDDRRAGQWPRADRQGRRDRGPRVHPGRPGRLPAWRRLRAGAQARQAAGPDACRRPTTLEYGTAAVEVKTDAFAPGDRVLLIDDVLATGGTAAATAALIRRCGAEVDVARRADRARFPRRPGQPAWPRCPRADRDLTGRPVAPRNLTCGSRPLRGYPSTAYRAPG